jgi:hypothetical protein
MHADAVGMSDTHFRIDAVGVRAARALRDGARGAVSAVFERSFYIVIDGQWICVVPHGGGLGPLNAQCGESDLSGAIKRPLRVGDAVVIANKTVRIDPVLSFAFDRATTWRPAFPPAWDVHSLARGLAHLNQEVASRALPPEGLASLLTRADGGRLNAVAAAAREPLEVLRKMVMAAAGHDDFSPDVSALIPLLGLGPGLTPSGDDAIGGALIALHMLGQDGLRDAIWAKLSPHVAAATGDISRAHLEAAAEGFGHEAMHRVAASILTGDVTHLGEAIDAVDAIGHTSGWDALVGMTVALSAWLQMQDVRERSGEP